MANSDCNCGKIEKEFRRGQAGESIIETVAKCAVK